MVLVIWNQTILVSLTTEYTNTSTEGAPNWNKIFVLNDCNASH